MPIKFACECGKRLSAPDGSEGKRAKCPKCRKALIVPARDLNLETVDVNAATPPPGKVCPNCARTLDEGAVVCVGCGFDIRSGAMAGTPLAQREKAQTTYTFPFVKVLIPAGIVGVLVAGWFFVGVPVMSKLRMSRGVGYVTNGDLKKAVEYFEQNRERLSEADRPRADLFVQQLGLEMKLNVGKTLDQGDEIKPANIAMELTRKGVAGSAFMVTAKITNHGKAPLTLSRQYFYVRGIQDIVLAADHKDNTIDGLVVEPGQTLEGTIAFRTMPKIPVRRGRVAGSFDAGSGDYFFLSFNDGTNYVKRTLPF